MKNIKISVVIPVYNVEKYLPQCLESVINQTYDSLEIICVNDGSTDNSLKILEEYALKDARIRIIDQKNTGLSGARNRGVEASSGDCIMFVDSDDWIDLKTCEAAVDAMVKNDAHVVLWSYIKEFPGNPQPKRLFQEEEIVFQEHEVKQRLHRRFCGLLNGELRNPENADSIVTAWGKLYKSELIKKHKVEFTYTKLIGTEDALFNFIVFNNVSRAVYINKCFSHYRKDNAGSLTTKNKPQLFKQWTYLYDLMKKNIDDNNLGESYREALDNRIALSIIGLGLNELAGKSSSFEKIHSIKEIITAPRYRKAYINLKFQYFPVHWKVFFFCAKHGFSAGVYILLVIIKLMIGK